MLQSNSTDRYIIISDSKLQKQIWKVIRCSAFNLFLRKYKENSQPFSYVAIRLDIHISFPITSYTYSYIVCVL